MEKRLCPKCQRNVEPIKVFDRSPKTKKPYLITRCSYERCKWNFDIEDYTGPKSPEREVDDGRRFWKDFI